MLKFPKSAALAVLALTAIASPSLAEGDIDAGEKVFKKCRACHAVGEGAKHKVGPELNDIFGRTAGGAEGYKYSKAMIAAGEEGLVWDADSLTEYLTKVVVALLAVVDLDEQAQETVGYFRAEN